MIINSVVLFLTNAPYRIILIMNLSNPVQAEELFTTNQALYVTELGAKSMLLLNSAVNSFIYGLSSSFYRQAFLEAFGCAKYNTDVIGAERSNSKTNALKTRDEIENIINETEC